MIYVKIDPKTKLPVDIWDGDKGKIPDAELAIRGLWQSSWDWKSFEEVERLARYVTAMTGRTYVPVNHTEFVSPRFSIMELPKVGDAVSYSFNGDTYPDGYIVAMTKKLQITTSTGSKYRRYKNTSGWRKTGGTWWLVKGHIYEQNPHI